MLAEFGDSPSSAITDSPLDEPSPLNLSLSSSEAAALERILQEMNAAADETTERLDRMHLLMQEINTELQATSAKMSSQAPGWAEEPVVA